ncbi:MAG: DNA-processing protein DprA [Lentisphaerae bacterium]|nr:DNA-processing protein DprA [Lentisphaerota bacterium]
MNARDAHIVLNMMSKIGPVLVRSLKERLGSIEAILSADAEVLQTARGVGPELASAIVAQRSTLSVADELAAAERMGARVLTPVDAEYPAALREIHDPPLALYVQGAFESRDKHALAMVGTRHPSNYGREVAERLSEQLTKAGFTIVSGLAEGVDAVAHRAALQAGGRTVAVLGGALDRLYPPSNAGLARDVAGRGAVISEFAMGREPDRTTFPIRNRVVSGLSMGVVVVEASLKSGAMITARQALEQGRLVFAVPGRIDSERSLGCHSLIRSGAVLVRHVDDILEEFEFLIPRTAPVAASTPARERVQLSEQEASLVAALGDGEQDVDTLIRLLGLKPAVVSSLLLGLEMKRVIRLRPGRTVELIRSEGRGANG